MTHIVAGFTTKKFLKETLARRVRVIFEDPSVHNPKEVFVEWNGPHLVTNLTEGETIFCTNHPKRSWFAKITRKGNILKVE